MTQSADLGAIANVSRSLYRGRANVGFQALASNHAGNDEPTATYPFMIWYQTSTNGIFMRDGSNTSWVWIGYLSPQVGFHGSADIVNVKSYGALGNGANDDTSAVQAALTAAANKTLYFPAGTYLLYAQLGLSNYSVNIVGAGVGVTDLRWPSGASSRGIYLSANHSSQVHEIRDVRLTTGGTSGTAITLDYSAEIQNVGGVLATMDRVSPRYIVENCHIVGAYGIDSGNFSTDGWMVGIYVVAPVGGRIKNIHIANLSPAQYGGARGVTGSRGIRITGNPAAGTAENGHPVELLVDSCWVWFCEYGISFENCEGCYVGFSQIIGCDVGIWAYSQYGHPQINVHDCHTNTYLTGILVQGQDKVNIHNNLIYGTTISSGWSGVHLMDAADSGTVSLNIFENTGTNGSGIVVDSSHISLVGNTFVGANITTCHWLRSGSDNIRICSPVYHNAGNNVLNQGTSNTYFNASTLGAGNQSGV